MPVLYRWALSDVKHSPTSTPTLTPTRTGTACYSPGGVGGCWLWLDLSAAALSNFIAGLGYSLGTLPTKPPTQKNMTEVGLSSERVDAVFAKQDEAMPPFTFGSSTISVTDWGSTTEWASLIVTHAEDTQQQVGQSIAIPGTLAVTEALSFTRFGTSGAVMSNAQVVFVVNMTSAATRSVSWWRVPDGPDTTPVLVESEGGSVTKCGTYCWVVTGVATSTFVGTAEPSSCTAETSSCSSDWWIGVVVLFAVLVCCCCLLLLWFLYSRKKETEEKDVWIYPAFNEPTSPAQYPVLQAPSPRHP